MRTTEFNPQEVEITNNSSEQDKEQAALKALINYVIDCASEANDFVSGDAVEQAKRHLSRSVLY